jgi:hypothetical protein
MGIYDALKDGVEVVQKAGNIEVMKKLLDAQKEALELFDENRRLKEENAALKQQRDVSERLTHDGKRYWLKGTKSEEGPYCQTCWDVDRRLVRLVVTSDRDTDGKFYGFCAYCAGGRK